MKASRLIIVPQGGLANRMRAIASAYTLSKALNRPLCVVWHCNYELNAPFSLIFKSENLPFQILEANTFIYHFLYEYPRKKNLFISRLSTFLGNKKILWISNSIQNEVINSLKVHKGDIIINSGLSFVDFLPEILHEIFKFTDEVISAKHQILKGYRPQIAVQIRRTDNSNSIGRSPISLFQNKIKEVVMHDSSAKIFLATDDEQTKSYLYGLFPANIVYNPARASRTTPRGIIEAAAEFLIMSECKKIYGSYWSSFSEIAALYGCAELEVLSLP